MRKDQLRKREEFLKAAEQEYSRVRPVYTFLVTVWVRDKGPLDFVVQAESTGQAYDAGWDAGSNFGKVENAMAMTLDKDDPLCIKANPQVGVPYRVVIQ
ncbi:MAG: hypothetical protein KGL39_45780 [Patescibacteria group bacterium]|nr:hypothetical protein [Patescibacteria group bacterium]